MRLEAGTRLGPYEIQAALGAGGFGEVYKARDTRLDRTVAIKILPSTDPELKARFAREAKAVAALQHPHICTLHDIGHLDPSSHAEDTASGASREAIDYLVLEHLEGETLAARITRGPLDVREAVQIGLEIASALDKAHRAGIVHRDLKPANVMLTRSGVKLLDFGLAKLRAPAATATAQSIAATQALAVTRRGTILGTVPYMSPEQLAGEEADTAADIWAFGCVLFEMLTGRAAFEGATDATLAAAIVHVEPPPLTDLRPRAPGALDRLVRACLVKDREARWQSAADLARELTWMLDGGDSAASVQPRRRAQGYAWMALAMVFLLATVAMTVAYLRRPEPERLVLRSAMTLPANVKVYPFTGPMAISPDGRYLAFVALTEGRYLLWLRPLASLEPLAVTGTDGAFAPFWSPDSRSVGFFAQGKLKAVDLGGRTPRVICDAPGVMGTGTWSRGGVILFGVIGGGLSRVAATGGAPTRLTSPQQARGELGHLWPQFLPDGNHFIFYADSSIAEHRAVYVGAMDSSAVRRLVGVDSMAVYVPQRFLLFARGDALMAQPFDPTRLELTGEPMTVASPVWSIELGGVAMFSLSDSGTLVYGTPQHAVTRLIWVDRAGKRLGDVGEAGPYVHIALSPDERQIVFERLDVRTQSGSVWLLDPSRGVSTRLTTESDWRYKPLWSPDGRDLAFSGLHGNSFAISQRSLASGAERQLTTFGDVGEVDDWSRDGKFIVFSRNSLQTGNDVWALPLAGDAAPFPFLQTNADELSSVLSPDSRWLAYSSNESGRLEVYVRAFPSGAGKIQVSSSGGSEPQWRRDGKELYYVAADRSLMAVPVRADSAFEAAAADRLFKIDTPAFFTRRDYAVSGDGRRFLVNALVDMPQPAPFTIVENWAATLQK